MYSTYIDSMKTSNYYPCELRNSVYKMGQSGQERYSREGKERVETHLLKQKAMKLWEDFKGDKR